jgi:hypothetical protein
MAVDEALLRHWPVRPWQNAECRIMVIGAGESVSESWQSTTSVEAANVSTRIRYLRYFSIPKASR